MIPHFAVPFRFSSGAGRAAVTWEQDTLEEVAGCVEAVMRYPPGTRSVQTEFGIEDLAFLATMPLDDIASAIDEWEPRAEVLVEEDWDLEEMLARVRLEVGYQTGEGT